MPPDGPFVAYPDGSGMVAAVRMIPRRFGCEIGA